MDPELYIRKNPVRRWCAEIERANEGIVLSPYVTSTTAETVLSKGVRTLGTLFEPELFLTGASSLNTLSRLARENCQILHVPNLHAKIVLVPGKFASIGSQNLTQSGTKRREATLVTRSKRILSALEDAIDEWLSDAVPISLERIEILLRMLRPLMRKQNALIKELGLVDAAAKAEYAAHLAAEEKQRLARNIRDRRISEIQKAIEVAPRVAPPKELRLMRRPKTRRSAAQEIILGYP